MAGLHLILNAPNSIKNMSATKSFKLPDTLYHGTTSLALPGISQIGLVPREVSGQSNWGHSVESRADAIYLTTCYGLHYAKAAADQAGGEPTILEIDATQLDATLFAADEDGVALIPAGRKGLPEEWSLEQIVKYWRGQIHTVAPKTTLMSIGNCTYFGGIPATAVKNVLVISMEDALRLTMEACDPVIAPINFKLFGAEFKKFSSWLFRQSVPYEADSVMTSILPGIARHQVKPTANQPAPLNKFLPSTNEG